MILNEIVDYLMFRDFIIPLGFLIGGWIGYLIICVKDKIKRRKRNRK